MENQIKEARLAAGLQIKELAVLIGAPYRTIQNYDNGVRQAPPWIENLIIEKIKAAGK